MPTDKKSIDAYNKNSEMWTKAKRDGSAKFHIYYEKPAIYGALPDLKEKEILCIGSGSGEEVEKLYELGAKKVIGIDISEELIKISRNSYKDYEFYQMDMEEIDFPDESFDLVFSSLTLHYLETWREVFKNVYKILKKNGIFIFSTGHPFFTAIDKFENEKGNYRISGYIKNKESMELEIYGDYFTTRKKNVALNNIFEVTNWHRPLGQVIKEITESGFELIDIIEPVAIDEAKEVDLQFWEIHQRIPEFIIYKLRKK